MLEPKYFNDKADRMIEIYRELENFIMQDIANRLLKSQSVSGTADRMIWKLQQMGECRAEIMNKLSQITGLSKRELKVLLQDAVMTSWSDDLQTFKKLGMEVVNPLENVAVMSVMNAEYIKSQGELENLTRTAMNQSAQDLIKMLDEADMRVANGLQSYSSAICDILDRYAGNGLMIDYPTGTRRTLEAAVRMCVVTSMNQTSAQITNQYIVEGGIEYVLVSAHLGARTQQEGLPYLSGHENWQGKVYKIRGSEEGFPNLLEMTGYDIDQNGRGKVVNPLGLHGYNCRHSHKPWDKNLKNPYIDDKGNPKIDIGENREKYEAQQKQRAVERAIRKTKRELLMKQSEIDGVAEIDVKKMLQSEYDKLAYRLKKQNEAYNKFCKENNLQKHSDRLKVAGFKRQQASKTNGRARAYEYWKVNENVVKTEENDIIGDIKKVVDKKFVDIHNKKHDFAPITLDKLPVHHAINVEAIIDSAPDHIKKLFDKHYEEINIISYNPYYNNHYSPNAKGIRIRLDKLLTDKRGKYTSLFHEIGHNLDDILGRPSHEQKFFDAIVNDINTLLNDAVAMCGKTDKKEICYFLYKNLSVSQKTYSMTDILSAVSGIDDPYRKNRDRSYWNKVSISQEVFAHFFEATARNDADKLIYLKNMMPEAYAEFIKSIGGQ